MADMFNNGKLNPVVTELSHNLISLFQKILD